MTSSNITLIVPVVKQYNFSKYFQFIAFAFNTKITYEIKVLMKSISNHEFNFDEYISRMFLRHLHCNRYIYGRILVLQISNRR